MKTCCSGGIADRSRKGCHRTLNSGVYQHKNSIAQRWSVQARRLFLSNTAPLIATHTDSVMIAAVKIRAGVRRRLVCWSATAIASEAGTDAIRKKRGPHAHPPYQDHHFA